MERETPTTTAPTTTTKRTKKPKKVPRTPTTTPARDDGDEEKVSSSEVVSSSSKKDRVKRSKKKGPDVPGLGLAAASGMVVSSSRTKGGLVSAGKILTEKMQKEDMKALLAKIKTQMDIAEKFIHSLIQMERLMPFLTFIDEYDGESEKEKAEQLRDKVKKWEAELETPGFQKATIKKLKACIAMKKEEAERIENICLCQHVFRENTKAALSLDFWLDKKQDGSTAFRRVMTDVFFCGESIRFLDDKANWDRLTEKPESEKESLMVFAILYLDYIEEKPSTDGGGDQINVDGRNRTKLMKLYQTADRLGFIL